jgi:hypothetical protein
VRVEADHLGAGRIRASVPRGKVELELPLTLGEHRPQDDPERRPALELRRSLLDRQQIGEGILAAIARPVQLPHETPLLQVAQVVLGHRGIEAADVAQAVRTAGR